MGRALALLGLLSAGCSYTMDSRYACDDMAHEPRVLASVTATTKEGEIKVCVREVVSVPASGEVALREAEVESYAPWDPIEKAVAAPTGALIIALTPVAIVAGVVGTIAGWELQHSKLPPILIPVATVELRVGYFVQFLWVFQPLPGLRLTDTDVDELPLRRTEGERTAARTGLAPGEYSVPEQAVPVRVRYGDDFETGTAVTDRDGIVRFAVPTGALAAGRRASVDLLLPDGIRTVEIQSEAVGGEFSAFPPDLPAGK
jgi:hypothetical protein